MHRAGLHDALQPFQRPRPVLAPPRIRHRPFGIAGPLHGVLGSGAGTNSGWAVLGSPPSNPVPQAVADGRRGVLPRTLRSCPLPPHQFRLFADEVVQRHARPVVAISVSPAWPMPFNECLYGREHGGRLWRAGSCEGRKSNPLQTRELAGETRRCYRHSLLGWTGNGPTGAHLQSCASAGPAQPGGRRAGCRAA